MTRYLLAFALVVSLVPPTPAAEPIDFSREIQPILSEHCYACHGPDEKARKKKLRVDTKDGLAAIVTPGKVAESSLYARILESDHAKMMPPPKFGKPLKTDQIAKLKTWIEQGAKWNEHWAFVAPKKSGEKASGVRATVDSLLLERLKKEGLSYNPEATKATWLRRVTFDLTGLPPTPKELDAFLLDSSANAKEKVVDRLLASPRFGEHQARFWLDYARYGDTHGLHLDNFREMWLYRDWVINAFNANKRYDQFIIEQLAGDLLPNATTEQLMGTGFLRCNITTSEGGSINEEVYVRNVVDNVDTFGTVMLGLTTGCARCHDHKYDPFSTKEYYSLFAYFNSIDGPAMDGNAARHMPVVTVPRGEQGKQLADAKARLATIEKTIREAVAKIELTEETPATGEAAKLTRKDVVLIDDALPKGSTIYDGSMNLNWKFVEKKEHEPQSGEKCVKLEAKELQQVVLEKITPGLRVGEGDKLFAYVWVDPKHPPREIMLQFHTAGWNHRAYWGENRIQWGTDRTGERRQRGQIPEAGKWARIDVDVAQLGLKPGDVINGIAFTQFDGTVYWDKAGISTTTPQGDRRFDKLTDWVKASAADTAVPQAVRDIIKLEAAKRTDAQKKQLASYFIEHGYTKTREKFEPLHAEKLSLEGTVKKLESEIPATYIFKESAQPKPAYILKRGEYDQRGEAVSRVLPKMLPEMPKDAPNNRLGIARWLTDAKHPLTARVAVNRFWQQIFGTGLVKTTEDFGTTGELPSHPELLDHLAVDFRESGWDVKRLVKELVLTNAYAQSAKVTPEKLAKDPGNRLYARGPRFRLDAEMVRDQALYVSGLLQERIGGSSVKPPQPFGLWEAVGYSGSNTARFNADTTPEKVHRRSLYTFWKRTAPPPQMTALDAPSRESCTVRRERTNTPMQALLLMNETQFLEASRALAERSIKEGGNDAMGYLFKLVACRPMRDEENRILSAAHTEYLATYTKDVAGAKKLISVGETKPDAKLDAPKVAAMMMIANTVLNLDEVLTK